MALETPPNGVGTTLSASITNVATTCSLASATGFTNAQYHVLIADGTNSEIALATALSGTTLTITRAVEAWNGAQTAFAFSAGASITVVPTVGSVVALAQGYSPQSQAGKNAIINGGMDIWQRGTSFASVASATTYCLDRWCYNTAATAGTFTLSQVASGIAGYQYALRVQRTSGSAVVSPITVATSLETMNSVPLAGQPVTLSVELQAGANFSAANLSVALDAGTGTDQNVLTPYTGATTALSGSPAPSTTAQRFSFTGTVPATATELGMTVTYTPIGTAGTDDYFDITGVQLELGSVATPFSRSGGSIGGELALCQRYYWQTAYNAAYGDTPLGSGFAYSTTAVDLIIPFPVPMRAQPSVTASNGTNYFYAEGAWGAAYANTIGSWPTLTPLLALGRMTVSGVTAGQGCRAMMTASASSMVTVNAEL